MTLVGPGGAFMFDLPFLIATRQYVYLLAYLLMIVPILNLVVYIGLKIFLGIKGRELAESSSTFASADERAGFFKGFDWAGKVTFFVGLIAFVLSILALVAGVSVLGEIPEVSSSM